MVATFHLPFALCGKQGRIWKSRSRKHDNFCQQHDHAAVLSLLDHFYFESLYSRIIQVYNLYIICIQFVSTSYGLVIEFSTNGKLQKYRIILSQRTNCLHK